MAWEQLSAFPSVSREAETVTSLERAGRTWFAETPGGRRWRAGEVLLATGVVDVHPELDGFRERWGQGIPTCVPSAMAGR